jgi:hypothetical protein
MAATRLSPFRSTASSHVSGARKDTIAIDDSNPQEEFSTLLMSHLQSRAVSLPHIVSVFWNIRDSICVLVQVDDHSGRNWV